MSPSTLLRWGVGLALLSIGIVSLVALAQVFKNPSSWVDAGSIAEVRRRHVVFVQKPRAFVVAEGTRFVALNGFSPHRADIIYYCRSSGWFEDLQGGSKFDAAGYYRAGPSPRGMDRYQIHVRDEHVYLDARAVAEGPKRGEKSEFGDAPAGPFCAGSRGARPANVDQGFMS